MNGRNLLTRTQFREGVFERDRHVCVFCSAPAKDAHHILERRLFDDGGYYLDNGASVCEEHHLMCERTLISVEEVRERCGIRRPLVPDHMYEDESFDKWGNMVLANGRRLKGPLFQDESVQKVLKEGNVLDLFIDQVKYPRTMHCTWSEGLHDDDRMLKNMDFFVGKEVVVTEKLDGENTSMYHDYIHARSIDSRSHPTRDWVKNFWAEKIAYQLPEGWRLCGENVYAEHSIAYDNLKSYFYGFSIWDEQNRCLDWDETLIWFELFGVEPVPILYRGIYDEVAIKSLYDSKKDWATSEGYVIRLAEGFHYSNFRRSVAKFVRKGHVQTAKHWLHGRLPNANKLA